MKSGKARQTPLVPLGDTFARQNSGKTEFAPASVLASSSRRPSEETHEFGVGSAFLKMFHGAFSEMLFLPTGFQLNIDCHTNNWINITGPSGNVHSVVLDYFGDRFVFRRGWSQLVSNEHIEPGDIGYFYRTETLGFTLTVLSSNGIQKKYRPIQLPPHHPLIDVDVRYASPPTHRMTNETAGALTAIWYSSRHPILLYVCSLCKSAIEYGSMSFTRAFSEEFPAEDLPALLRFNGSGEVMEGALVHREDDVVRITRGWNDFHRKHRLIVGRDYIFKFQRGDAWWYVTVHQV